MHFKAYCTYHNVGQGLFFSGKLKLRNKEFNFVYDCGSEALKQLKNRIDSFIEILPQRNNKKFLDLLVISHFHNDHINGLDYLLDKIKINTVVIPYISPVEILLYAIVNSKPPFPPDSYYQFLANPFTYLLEKGVGKIIVIGRGNEEGYEGDDFIPPDTPIEPNVESPFNYDKQGDDKGNKRVRDKLIEEYQIEDYINDGKVIPRSHYGYSIALGICLFRFFNAQKSIPNFDHKLERFKNCLNNELGIKDINNSILAREDILDEIKKKRRKNEDDNKFGKCYEKAFGKNELNITSLILFKLILAKYIQIGFKYRFLFPSFHYIYDFLFSELYHYYKKKKIYGQILTGDAKLKNKKIFEEFKRHYKRVLDKSLIFQLPHHGSKDNWNRDILEELVNNEIFVAPAGIDNKYNHPSWNVIWEIIASGKFPIFVNELNWFQIFIKAYY